MPTKIWNKTLQKKKMRIIFETTAFNKRLKIDSDITFIIYKLSIDINKSRENKYG